MWQPRIFGITTVALFLSVLWLRDGRILAQTSGHEPNAQAIRVDITIKAGQFHPSPVSAPVGRSIGGQP